MSGRRASSSIAVFVLSVVLAGAAGAETPRTETTRPKEPAVGPCNADLARFCKGVERGGGKIRTCLLSHASDLAPECRSHLQAAAPVTATTTPASGATGPASTAPTIPKRLAACDTDIRMYCPGVTAGGGRLRACLDLHVAKLAPACASVLKGYGRRPKK
jgi:hypothetical protein